MTRHLKVSGICHLPSVDLQNPSFGPTLPQVVLKVKPNADHPSLGRIQFSFHYPDLDIESRKQVWALFWKKALRTNNISDFISEDEIASLAKHELNGRQIKNTVSSAQSLALEEGVPLSKKHVETVLQVVQTWQTAVA